MQQPTASTEQAPRIQEVATLTALILKAEENGLAICDFLNHLGREEFLKAYHTPGEKGVVIGLHIEACRICEARLSGYGISKPIGALNRALK